MSISILMALKKSKTSEAVIDYVSGLPLKGDQTEVTLFHVFREPSRSEQLMDEDFIEKERPRAESFLNEARDKLVESGYPEDRIRILLASEAYETVTEGIIDQCAENAYDLVVIGRKRKSKAEEFVMGDVGVKLVRAMREKAILVVESA